MRMVRVSRVGGRNLVWDAEECYLLHTQHRITGSLLGSLPHFKQQNTFHSLPLCLLDEEVLVGLKHGFIEVFDDSEYQPPTPEDLVMFNKRREAEMEEQRKQMDMEKQKKREKYLSNATLTPKRKRDKKGKGTSELSTQNITNNNTTIMTNTITSTIPTNINNNQQTNATLQKTSTSDNSDTDESTNPSDKLPIFTPPSRPPSPSPSPSPSSSSSQNKEPGGVNALIHTKNFRTHRPTSIRISDFEYPKTETERTKFRVFEDLYQKGYYMTSASKFGGDYLAYPGDPLRYHAHYIIYVMLPDEPIPALKMISFGRLGVSVKKSPVYASEDEGGVKYITVDWQGVT